jgi:iron complex outermembrane receptor protein
MFGCIGFDYVFEQNKFAPLESKTKSYYLLNASFGFDVAVKRGSVNISVIGNNLLGAQYYDHLSRFKNYGIHNIGRNIQLMLRVPLLFNYSHSKIKS